MYAGIGASCGQTVCSPNPQRARVDHSPGKGDRAYSVAESTNRAYNSDLSG